MGHESRCVTHGGKRFTKGRLFRLLTNPIYVGKIDFKKQIYEGEHEAIVEAEIWERVQQILRRNGRDGGAEVRDSFGTVLKRLLRCASCDAGMARTYTTDESCRYRSYVCEHTQQEGHAKRVSESAIKAAMTNQIRRIGSDMRIVAHTFAKAEEQRRISVATLTLEREVAQRALASMRTELRKLLVVDCRDQPTTDRLADLQERIGQTERRLTEIVLELEHLESQVVYEGDLRTTLARFDPVWEALNSWERVLIIRSLIERVTYNGNSNKLTVRFISAGIREMCRGNQEERPATPLTTRERNPCDETSFPQIIQEFRCRFDARHQQMIPCAGAGDVKQVPLRVVDLFEIRVVRDRFDPLLQRNDLIVTGHHHDGTEFQALGEMHRADRSPATGRLNVVVEHLVGSFASSTAARARSSSAAERTKTPISCGTMPSLVLFTSH